MAKPYMKLDDLKKENVHSVPDGYFDELPQIIQSRVSKEKKSVWSPVLIGSLRYALPSVVVIMAVVYFSVLKPGQGSANFDELMAQVSTDELVEYLAFAELNEEIDETEFKNLSEDIIDEVTDGLFDEFDLQGLEDDDLLDLELYQDYDLGDDYL